MSKRKTWLKITRMPHDKDGELHHYTISFSVSDADMKKYNNDKIAILKLLRKVLDRNITWRKYAANIPSEQPLVEKENKKQV